MSNRFAVQSVSADTEDSYKVGVLGKPTQHSHFHLHPKQSDSYTKQIFDTRDMFYDNHNLVLNTAKYALKGAFIGGLLATSISLTYRQIPSLVLKKMFKYVRDNNFGSVKMFTHIASPYMVSGALAGSSWYIWYHLLWDKAGKNGFYEQVFGYGIYGMLSTAFLTHPKHYWAGALIGSFVGFLSWYVYQSNHYNNTNTQGYYIPIAELSEEEKIKQRNKDIVFELSQQPLVKLGLAYKM
ncbi:hypothetical protein PPERSA_04097 [Pseudocohnilembus persalinus]|uniref:Transmembrane protein n=1 Tax=Pseudocohnilembus persalinus TaxID=266149 RepID=A0A0V0QKY7_PSEPJ|nr:hypothetical protein PPERSA_04097 [Pseudocohnilembus persalinus]|eukprot:KRX02894.1 hypothetical protein PPERSA_04097 [Pseudocohnilembus persalinus]